MLKKYKFEKIFAKSTVMLKQIKISCISKSDFEKLTYKISYQIIFLLQYSVLFFSKIFLLNLFYHMNHNCNIL